MALDKSRLEQIMKMRSQQEVKKGYGSKDPKFPLFTTPVGKNLLVYIPALNVVTHEDGSEENILLETVIHDYSVGKMFGTIPCISGIPDDDPLAIELGYSGHTCPACDATQECWQLVDEKVQAFAREMGVDPNNDPTEMVKKQRSQFISDMAIKNHKEYVTFPIVVIPQERMLPVQDAVNKLEAYFVTMTKSRYTEKVIKSLNSLITNNGHIGGRFMLWQFIYDTDGKQATARDAARNANFTIITDAEALKYYTPLKEACEERAKEFTNIKALEVLPALECKSYSEILSETNRVMRQTRLTLAALNGGAQPQAQALPSSSPESVLQSFGAVPTTLGVGADSTDDKSKETPITRFG